MKFDFDLESGPDAKQITKDIFFGICAISMLYNQPDSYVTVK